ncbi:hypothetical protein MPH_04065 [Macrophomina phaseolina MS6]|uniref:Uncharacterized protein n=1 Tax=Macrophomina phaseolina (strain MS6) TaxID=1126212 RepID=K2S144_MACPH|nr:hypothetical protein MPH_04065 [Macrophomina phaseolina MS6]
MIRSLRENMYTPVTSIIRRYDRLTVTFLTHPANTTMAPLDVHAATVDGGNPAITLPRLLAPRLAQMGVLVDEAAAVQGALERRQGERARENLLLGALRGGHIEIEGSEGRQRSDDVRVRRSREDEDGSVAFDFLEPRQEDDDEDDEEAAQREIDQRMRLAGLKPGTAEVEEYFEQDELATDEEDEGQGAGAESDEEWVG